MKLFVGKHLLRIKCVLQQNVQNNQSDNNIDLR